MISDTGHMLVSPWECVCSLLWSQTGPMLLVPQSRRRRGSSGSSPSFGSPAACGQESFLELDVSWPPPLPCIRSCSPAPPACPSHRVTCGLGFILRLPLRACRSSDAFLGAWGPGGEGRGLPLWAGKGSDPYVRWRPSFY